VNAPKPCEALKASRTLDLGRELPPTQLTPESANSRACRSFQCHSCFIHLFSLNNGNIVIAAEPAVKLSVLSLRLAIYNYKITTYSVKTDV